MYIKKALTINTTRKLEIYAHLIIGCSNKNILRAYMYYCYSIHRIEDKKNVLFDAEQTQNNAVAS
jgi:hypothetical protein